MNSLSDYSSSTLLSAAIYFWYQNFLPDALWNKKPLSEIKSMPDFWCKFTGMASVSGTSINQS